MWPRAVVGALYNSVYMLGHLQLVKIKVALGFKLSAMDRNAQRLMAHAVMVRTLTESGAIGPDGKLRRPPPSPSGSQGLPRPNIPGMPSGINPAPSASKKELQQKKSEDGAEAKAPTNRIPIDIALALGFFVKSLGINLSRTRMDTAPKGCFFVFGQIEIMGTKGRCKVEVMAAYDPKTAKYAFIEAKLKHFWDLNQAAKGGRG